MAIPNLDQVACSNLSNYKTMEWLHDLPEGEKEQVIDLAVKLRTRTAKIRQNKDVS